MPRAATIAPAEAPLAPTVVDAITALAEAASEVDGTPALNEAGRLAVRHPRDEVTHLVAMQDDNVVGYAQLDTGSPQPTAQLVVAPQHRRQGIGQALLTEVLAASPRPVHIWATGDKPAAAALARRAGLRAERILLVMQRPLAHVPVVVPPAPGITLAAFRPGRDEDAWLTVNARAFARHPEQGSMTRTDLAERMAEPWFDPAGFLLAWEGDTLLGFHWTKQHDDGLGEVYVLGVDPAAGSRGLGTALLTAGLAFLAGRGNTRVELYVESGSRAVDLYRAHGFDVVSRDVMYAQPPSPTVDVDHG